MRFFSATLSLLPLVTSVLSAPLHTVDIEERAASTALSNVKQPTNGLPAPPAGVVLRWIGLGLGTQNYTCDPTNPTAAPTSNGAVATLYDISSLNNNKGLLSWMIPSLPGTVLNMQQFGGMQAVNMFLGLTGFGRNLGQHFFNQTMTPTFHLSGLRAPVPAPELFAKKLANVPAPDNSCKGTTGEGAVDWLYLEDVGTSISGVKATYRVWTAGGKAPATCEGQPATINVKYAAEYWFYGSP